MNKRNGSLIPIMTIACLVLGGARAIEAQSVLRQARVDSALAEGDREAAIRIMTRALDLSLGDPDDLWGLAAMFVAYNYSEMGDQPRAELWLRWALRYEPRLHEYSNAFTRNVQGLITQLRNDIGGDTLGVGRARWDFDGIDLDANGRMALGSSSLDDAVTVEIDGRGRLDDQVSLPPGTYSIRAIAYGEEVMRLDREVLPGVTTRLNLDLPVVEPPPGFVPAGGEQALGAVPAGGGFPVFAVLGALAVGGGAAAFFILGSADDGGGNGNGNPPPNGTGGIIINYPIR